MSEKLKPCPLCGTAASVTRLNHPDSNLVYNIACGVRDDGSDTCGLVLYGNRESRAEMVAKWNRRTKGAGECHCSMHHRMAGDGCAVCNPERANELESEE